MLKVQPLQRLPLAAETLVILMWRHQVAEDHHDFVAVALPKPGCG